MKKILVLILVLIGINLQNCISAELQKAGIERVELTFEQAYALMLENNNSLKAYNEMIKYSKYTDNKELLIVPNASHCDLYDQKDIIPFDKIEEFIRKNMK